MPIIGFNSSFECMILRLSLSWLTVFMLSELGNATTHCQIDVACPEGAPWPNQIRAVGTYRVVNTTTTPTITTDCTGTMLNNTKQDHTNYFLTAYHCFTDTQLPMADFLTNIKIYWKRQADSCGGAEINGIEQMGAVEFVAGHASSDFLLLKLLQPPPSIANVFYAGWDTRATVNNLTVGIHHPFGKRKRINISNSPVNSYTYNTNAGPGQDPGTPVMNGNHWGVDWSQGTTEKGSSGSCLFDDYGRCIGQLHGAYLPGCDNGNTISYYGKFSASWGDGDTDTTRLSKWLGPLPAGVTGIDGDPHITTTNDVHYDFQAAGEFVALRDPNGLEIQTRQTPVATANPIRDSHSELPVCVSINTAMAARVGNHVISYQPIPGSGPDPNNLQLRLDRKETPIGPDGLDLKGGGRIARTTVPGGLELDFPDGSVLFATPAWWPHTGLWHFNISLTRPPAVDGVDGNSFPIGGIAGAIESGDWLPRLPDGSSLGPRPVGLPERYVDLYQKFADAWRVTDESSLFYYGEGTSTENFTLRNWPPMDSPCIIPEGKIRDLPPMKPAQPVRGRIAEKACLAITDEHARRNCILDVRVTGNLGFAKAYRRSQCVVTMSTRTTLAYDHEPTGSKEALGLIVTVAQARADGMNVPTGSVQFMVDGRKVGKPVRLDANGQARWESTSLRIRKHKVSANYIPDQRKKFSPSLSALKVQNEDKN